MSFESWMAFCSIALLATATPGPAALLVSVNSLSYGFKQSLFTVLGNVSGLFIMSSFSVLGLSAVVAHSASLFTVIKVLGACYLIYIGINLWIKGLGQVNVDKRTGHRKGRFRLYLQGLLVSLTNPKAIVFTTALFPQFINVAEPLLPQFSLLVVSFMSLSFCCLTTYSLLAQRTHSSARRVFCHRLTGKCFGTTFIGAGCLLAGTSK